MKTEVFVVLLISLSGRVTVLSAKENTNTSNLDAFFNEIHSMILGYHMKPASDGFVSEYFSMKDDKNYYDHIIDLSLQQLKLLKKEYPIEAIIKQRGKQSSEMPLEGTIIFDGLHSLRTLRSREITDHTRIKRLKNGDIILMENFEFGNISGIGNFSGLNSLKESRNKVFQFHPAITDMWLSFTITNDSSRRKDPTVLDFDEVYRYDKQHGVESREDVDVTLILEQKALNDLDKMFVDLYNIIYERMTTKVSKEKHHFEAVLDNVINKIIQNAKPFKVRGEGSISNRAKATHNWWELNFDALRSLTRSSNVEIMNEMNEDPDFQTKIQFGNVAGKGFIFHQTPEVTFNENFTFTSPPVEVKAFFYLPRNRSFQAKAFHFVKPPSYTIQPQNEQFRSVFQKLLEQHGYKMYPQALYRILNQTHSELFPKTNFSQTNKNGGLTA